MAPARGTLAAGVALGVGFALLRASRDLLAERHPDGELALLPGEPLERGLKRMALEQLDLVIAQLTSPNGTPPDERAVHETRKALKRLRTLLRLLESSLGEQAVARETAQLRGVAHALAGARDSQVMLDTLDALVERRPASLRRDAGVRALRRHLAARHEQIRRDSVGDAVTLVRALGELRACRAAISAWELPVGDELELAEPGLRRLYRQGRRRLRRAAGAGRKRRTRTMHEWRKRVKDLRYATEMLQHLERHPLPALPGPPGRRERRRRARERRQAKELRRLARRADKLGEVLGEEHDLAVLAEITRSHARHGEEPHLGRRTRRRLLKAIRARRRKLRRRALREGERLYARSPTRLMRRLRAT